MVQLLHRWQHRPSYSLGASAANKSKNNAAQRGINYHRRVYRILEGIVSPEDQLLIEPWFRRIDDQPRDYMRSPDAVLRYPDQTALVIEVKLNWEKGKDEKLLCEYLPIVTSAFELTCVWPLLIVGCLRNLPTPPLLGLQQLEDALAWAPGMPTPVMLIP